jgi:hypothetical protein
MVDPRLAGATSRLGLGWDELGTASLRETRIVDVSLRETGPL